MSGDRKHGETVHSEAWDLAANVINACDMKANQKELLWPVLQRGHSNILKNFTFARENLHCRKTYSWFVVDWLIGYDGVRLTSQNCGLYGPIAHPRVTAICTIVWWYRLELTPNLSTRALWQPPALSGSPVGRDIFGASWRTDEGNENLVYSSPWDFKRFLTCRKILRHVTGDFISHTKKGVLWIFITLKNPSNPRPLGPVASTLTTNPPRRLWSVKCSFFFYLWKWSVCFSHFPHIFTSFPNFFHDWNFLSSTYALTQHSIRRYFLCNAECLGSSADSIKDTICKLRINVTIKWYDA
jgi:hypothetical protein